MNPGEYKFYSTIGHGLVEHLCKFSSAGLQVYLLLHFIRTEHLALTKELLPDSEDKTFIIYPKQMGKILEVSTQTIHRALLELENFSPPMIEVVESKKGRRPAKLVKIIKGKALPDFIGGDKATKTKTVLSLMEFDNEFSEPFLKNIDILRQPDDVQSVISAYNSIVGRSITQTELSHLRMLLSSYFPNQIISAIKQMYKKNQGGIEDGGLCYINNRVMKMFKTTRKTYNANRKK